MKKYDKLENIKNIKTGIASKFDDFVPMKKQGKTTIKWMPHGRNIVVVDDEKNNEEKKRLSSLGLIDPSKLSDKERLNLGFTSKSADIANKSSEEQPMYEVVAVGPEVMEIEVGDKVMFSPGNQAVTILVDGVYYAQLGEYDVLGKFL